MTAVEIVEAHLKALREELNVVRLVKGDAYRIMANEVYVMKSNEERELNRAIEELMIVLERLQS